MSDRGDAWRVSLVLCNFYLVRRRNLDVPFSDTGCHDSISEISIELVRATKLWCPVQALEEDVERFIGKRPHICLAIG